MIVNDSELKKQKIVVIGDIVASKKIAERLIIQEQIQELFNSINDSNPCIVSPYTITLGDEFQAVLRCADDLFRDFIYILSAIYPHKIRFSIGLGDISTPINQQQAIGMDGTAFHHARNGIMQLKKTGYLFKIEGIADAYHEIVENSLYMISFVMNNWNHTRFLVLKGLFQNMKVKEIASENKITDKAVYKNISGGALKIIYQLLTELEVIINKSIDKNGR